MWIILWALQLDFTRAAACVCFTTAAIRRTGLISSRNLPRYRHLGEYLSAMSCHAKGLVMQKVLWNSLKRLEEGEKQRMKSFKHQVRQSSYFSNDQIGTERKAFHTDLRKVLFNLQNSCDEWAFYLRNQMSFLPQDFAWSCLFVQKGTENLMKFRSLWLVNLWA